MLYINLGLIHKGPFLRYDQRNRPGRAKHVTEVSAGIYIPKDFALRNPQRGEVSFIELFHSFKKVFLSSFTLYFWQYLNFLLYFVCSTDNQLCCITSLGFPARSVLAFSSVTSSYWLSSHTQLSGFHVFHENPLSVHTTLCAKGRIPVAFPFKPSFVLFNPEWGEKTGFKLWLASASQECSGCCHYKRSWDFNISFFLFLKKAELCFCAGQQLCGCPHILKILKKLLKLFCCLEWKQRTMQVSWHGLPHIFFYLFWTQPLSWLFSFQKHPSFLPLQDLVKNTGKHHWSSFSSTTSKNKSCLMKSNIISRIANNRLQRPSLIGLGAGMCGETLLHFRKEIYDLWVRRKHCDIWKGRVSSVFG